MGLFFVFYDFNYVLIRRVKAISVLRVILQGGFGGEAGIGVSGMKIIDELKKSDAIFDHFIEEEHDSKVSSFMELLNLGLPDEYTAGKK